MCHTNTNQSPLRLVLQVHVVGRNVALGVLSIIVNYSIAPLRSGDRRFELEVGYFQCTGARMQTKRSIRRRCYADLYSTDFRTYAFRLTGPATYERSIMLPAGQVKRHDNLVLERLHQHSSFAKNGPFDARIEGPLEQVCIGHQIDSRHNTLSGCGQSGQMGVLGHNAEWQVPVSPATLGSNSCATPITRNSKQSYRMVDNSLHEY